MDALFSRNVEDKEVFFKKNDNVEGVVENVRESEKPNEQRQFDFGGIQIRN